MQALLALVLLAGVAVAVSACASKCLPTCQEMPSLVDAGGDGAKN